MLFNGYFLNLFSYIFLCFFTKALFFNFNTIDLLFRLNPNDSFINSYAFFWTNFWYLPIFFFSCLLFFIFLWQRSFVFLLAPLLCFFYFYEIQDFIVINYQLNFCNLNLNGFNSFLFNNINKYHPFLFYVSVCYVFLSLRLCLFSFKPVRINFIKGWAVFANYGFFFSLFLFNAISLFLGSWWALQEGTWGGWWNWDSSEVFGLLFLLLSLVFLHARPNLFIFLKQIYYHILFISFLVVTYYFIQLNFDLVSHNFGIKFFFFFNNNFFFLESITLLFIFFCLFLTFYVFFFIRYSLLFKYPLPFKVNKDLYFFFKTFYLAGLFLLFLLFFFFSFNLLFNYFFWNFLALNIFNSEISIYFYSTLSGIFIFYIMITFSSFFLYLILPTALSYNFVLVFFFLCSPSFSFFFYLHYILVNFLFTNTLNLKLQLSFWILRYYTDSLLSLTNLYLSASFYSCDTTLLEYLSPAYSYFGTYVISWSITLLVNFFQSSVFNFFCYSNNFFNLLTLSDSTYSVSLYIETLFINNHFIWLIFFLLIFSYYKSKNKNRFY